jgi:hypothetical protein
VAGWLSRIETELTVDEGVREEDIAGIFAAGTVGRFFFVITRKGRRDRTIMGGATTTIISRSLKTKRNQKNFKIGKKNLFLKSYMCRGGYFLLPNRE